MNELRLPEMKVVLAFGLKNVNGLDFIFPGASSSNSSIAGPSNPSSNIDSTPKVNKNQEIVTTTNQTKATVKPPSTTTSATINVSASLNRKFMLFFKRFSLKIVIQMLNNRFFY